VPIEFEQQSQLEEMFLTISVGHFVADLQPRSHTTLYQCTLNRSTTELALDLETCLPAHIFDYSSNLSL
jgi:hypothetical protein